MMTLSAPASVPFAPRLLVLLLGMALANSALAEERTGTERSGERQTEFADLSIEELANIDVTSVSKRPERLQDAPASVFVITADDIRRAGELTGLAQASYAAMLRRVDLRLIQAGTRRIAHRSVREQ